MAIVPTTQFIQFNLAANPSGARHILASGIKELDTSANGFLDFGNNNVATSGVISQTRMLIFRASSMGTASGIYNMRFFLVSASAFNTGTYRFLHSIQRHWQGANFALGLSSSDILTSLPVVQNLFSTQLNQSTISGILDADVSQYIYLAVYTDVNVPFGTYGSGGAGSFRYRCQFDFS